MRLFPLLAVFLASPALAQQVPSPLAPPGPQAQPMPTVMAEPVAVMIAAFDRDGDARVTRAEFDAGLRHSFDAVDAGKAGALGYIAFSDWSERWLGDRNTLPSPFETDRDGDGHITYAELAARFDLLFARFDTDKDGVLTRRELMTVRPQMFERDRGKRRRDRDIMGPEPRN
jgi:Ca2+-binding EF-hand superfamily protein